MTILAAIDATLHPLLKEPHQIVWLNGPEQVSIVLLTANAKLQIYRVEACRRPANCLHGCDTHVDRNGCLIGSNLVRKPQNVRLAGGAQAHGARNPVLVFGLLPAQHLHRMLVTFVAINHTVTAIAEQHDIIRVLGQGLGQLSVSPGPVLARANDVRDVSLICGAVGVV
ncbi:hypothetical protein [Rhodobacter sp. 24-YEA-8]|uniref:hypothetical protein n=1 Tax=Rhodobacter sp. 24-YEA-8 TaxID=1884310 RepID=UPI000B869433|nr:hypothetical protein [Rhodobacter sp. 24-YEA-8]